MGIRSDTAGHERSYLLDMLPAQTGRALEIGCGDGRLTRKYAHIARQVIGIDLESALPSDKPADIPGYRCLAASGARLPFAKSSFDGAIFALSF